MRSAPAGAPALPRCLPLLQPASATRTPSTIPASRGLAQHIWEESSEEELLDSQASLCTGMENRGIFTPCRAMLESPGGGRGRHGLSPLEKASSNLAPGCVQ